MKTDAMQLLSALAQARHLRQRCSSSHHPGIHQSLLRLQPEAASASYFLSQPGPEAEACTRALTQ